MRSFILTVLWYLPPTRGFAEKRLPYYRKGYSYYWVSEEGKKYRQEVYERQKKGGSRPLESNPTYEEVGKEIDKYAPHSILEVGCGWGRIIEALKPHYPVVEGCDISTELLALVPKDIYVFTMDIVNPKDVKKHWDVVFCRGVMQYFLGHPEDMKRAMQTLDELGDHVILWEWPHVLHALKQYGTAKFEYHPTGYGE